MNDKHDAATGEQSVALSLKQPRQRVVQQRGRRNGERGADAGATARLRSRPTVFVWREPWPRAR